MGISSKFKYISRTFYKYIYLKTIYNVNSNIDIFDKASFIPKTCKFSRLFIFKGSTFRRLLINTHLIGYRAGHFCLTRKFFVYTKKLKTKR